MAWMLSRVARQCRRAALVAAVAWAASAPSLQAQDGGTIPILKSFADGNRSLTNNTSVVGPPGVFSSMINPATLGGVERFGLGASYSSLFAGTAYNFLGGDARLPKGYGGVGWGFYRLTTAQAEQRDAQGNQTGSFGLEEMILKVGFGRTSYRWAPGLSLGAYLSDYKRTLAGDTDGFYSVDLGARYLLPFMRDLSVGAMINNAMWKAYGNSSDSLPRLMRVGASYTLLDGLFSINSDVQITSPLNYSFGLGYSPLSMVSFNMVTREGLFGGGLKINFKDYALHYNMGVHELGMNHELGLEVYLGKPDSSLRRYLESLYSAAEQDVHNGEYANALARLKKAYRFAPLPDKEKAVYEGLLRLKDANITVLRGDGDGADLLRRGVAFYLTKKNDMAIEIFRSALYKDPRSLVVQRLLAMARGGDEKGNAVSLPSFTEVDPLKLKMTKAEQYFQDQMWDLALKELREILEINPKEVAAYVRLGSVYFVMGLKEKARQSWAYAIQLDPNHPDSQSAKRFLTKEGLQ